MSFPPLSLFNYCTQSILKRKWEVKQQADAHKPLILRNESKIDFGIHPLNRLAESYCINSK